MATLNAAATLEQASDFASDFAGATLEIKDGATVLATHTITSWSTANSGQDATATAVIAASGVATIANSGTADGATITASGKVITLTVATTPTVGGNPTDLVLSTLTYISGEDSTVSSVVVTFAS